jgi:hypothetical protein
LRGLGLANFILAKPLKCWANSPLITRTFWALAQQAGKRPTIGFFSAGSAAAVSSWVAALVQRLGELGWVEGLTVVRRRQGRRRQRRSPAPLYRASSRFAALRTSGIAGAAIGNRFCPASAMQILANVI